MKFNRDAFERYIRACEKGILTHNAETETEQEIIETVLKQEIVSFCSSKGCVSFDISDIEGEF